MSDRIALAGASVAGPPGAGSSATCIMFDSPYSCYGPMRNTGDRSAGQVRAPFSFMSRCMGLCFRALMIYVGGQNGVGADGKVVCKLPWRKSYSQKKDVLVLSDIPVRSRSAWCRL